MLVVEIYSIMQKGVNKMIDYLYYKKDFNGSIIPDEEQFNKNADLAQRYINTVINCKAVYNENVVADCICAVAEKIYEYGDNAGIKSESIDGCSVTYTDQAVKNFNTILKLYLPSSLLYRGL